MAFYIAIPKRMYDVLCKDVAFLYIRRFQKFMQCARDLNLPCQVHPCLIYHMTCVFQEPAKL